jgi:hypothetical protein
MGASINLQNLRTVRLEIRATQTGPHAEVADGRLYAIRIICGQCDWKSRQAQTGPTPRLPDGSLYAPPYTVETLGVLRLEKSPMCALKALRMG